MVYTSKGESRANKPIGLFLGITITGCGSIFQADDHIGTRHGSARLSHSAHPAAETGGDLGCSVLIKTILAGIDREDGLGAGKSLGENGCG